MIFKKEINKTYNNTETTMKVKNDKGKLKIASEKIQSFIKYIAAGGGKWVLGVAGKGSRKVDRIKSTQSTRTVHLKITDDRVDLQIILNEIRVINEVLNGTTEEKQYDENQD